MSLIPFSDLLKTPSFEDWKNALESIATGVQLKTRNWSKGGFTRTMMALFAQAYQTAGDVVRIIAESAFLDTAVGAWLKFVAKEVFNVDVVEATFAEASLGIRLTNATGRLFTFEVNDITFAHNTSKKTYRNKSAGTLNPGVGQTLDLDIIAEEAGSASNAAVDDIQTLITSFPGVTCTNTLPLSGLDEESKASIVAKCRASQAARSPGGPKKAYEFLAKSAVRPDGTPVGITRIQIPPPPGDGTMIVYLAGPSGALAGGDIPIVQDLFDRLVIPYGFDATATNSVNHGITAPCTIWVPAELGFADAEIKQAVFDALKAYTESLPVGGVIIAPTAGRVYWRALLGIIEGAVEGTLKAQLTSEADIVIAVGEVPIWSGVLGDTTVVQVT